MMSLHPRQPPPSTIDCRRAMGKLARFFQRFEQVTHDVLSCRRFLNVSVGDQLVDRSVNHPPGSVPLQFLIGMATNFLLRFFRPPGQICTPSKLTSLIFFPLRSHTSQ